jgi:hypothetical protein
VSSPEAKTCGVYSEDTQIRTPDNGGSARGYQAIFVASATLGSPGFDGQPAVYLYIATLEVNVLNCRDESALSLPRPGPVGRSRLTCCVAWAS